MTKKLTARLLVIVCLFIWGCEKSEENNFNSISGVVTTGENVSAEDLNNTFIALGKLNMGFDPALLTTQSTEVELIDTTKIAANGSFEFKDLERGNYALIPSNDLMFAPDTFLVANVDGKNLNKIDATLERMVPDNAFWDRDTEYRFSIVNGSDALEKNERISKLIFYEDGNVAEEINAPREDEWDLRVTMYSGAKKTVKVIVTDGTGNIIYNSTLKIGNGVMSSDSNYLLDDDGVDFANLLYGVSIDAFFGFREIKYHYFLTGVTAV
uniref:hypothetical protein n=1 Tax=uncultured Draconibacterium sp. TaxID=1573823 RepID=UPI0032167973